MHCSGTGLNKTTTEVKNSFMKTMDDKAGSKVNLKDLGGGASLIKCTFCSGTGVQKCQQCLGAGGETTRKVNMYRLAMWRPQPYGNYYNNRVMGLIPSRRELSAAKKMQDAFDEAQEDEEHDDEVEMSEKTIAALSNKIARIAGIKKVANYGGGDGGSGGNQSREAVQKERTTGHALPKLKRK